jgi:1-phosphofructokinase
MILTVTPNPSLDRTYEIATVARGEVNRARAAHTHPGGKGINVTRALVAGGRDSIAALPVGGADGAQIITALGSLGIPVLPVPIAGTTRSNATLAEADGTTTKINAPGPRLSSSEVGSLLEAVDRHLTGRSPSSGNRPVVVGAGSLPHGVEADFYVRLAAVARSHDADLVVDTSGRPLAAVAAAGVATLLKPNEDELAELVGHELATVRDVVTAARELIAAGTREVLVSLGEHGAILVSSAGTWWAGGDPLIPLSTVGAGDTTLAGYLASGAHERGPDDLTNAVAWGRAAVLLPGSAVPQPQHVRPHDVRVVADPEPHIALKEL